MKLVQIPSANNRRNFLKTTVIAGVYGLLNSATVHAKWLEGLFSSSTLEDSLSYSFKTEEIALSDDIELKLPTIAENGAVVPITVTSTLENVEQVYIFVEQNPIPLVAVFDLSPDVDAFVSARIKMAKTSDVIAVVKAQSTLYKAQQLVKVTIGGCGG